MCLSTRPEAMNDLFNTSWVVLALSFWWLCLLCIEIWYSKPMWLMCCAAFHGMCYSRLKLPLQWPNVHLRPSTFYSLPLPLCRTCGCNWTHWFVATRIFPRPKHDLNMRTMRESLFWIHNSMSAIYRLEKETGDLCQNCQSGSLLRSNNSTRGAM